MSGADGGAGGQGLVAPSWLEAVMAARSAPPSVSWLRPSPRCQRDMLELAGTQCDI